MTRSDPLDRAARELRAAYTLVADPSCEDVTARVHLHAAATALAEASTGTPRDPLTVSLPDLLDPAHRDAESADALAAQGRVLRTALDPTQDLPSTRDLLRVLRTLDRLRLRVHEATHGLAPFHTHVWRWTVRLGLTAVAVATVFAISLRPWQRDDVGPWRAAYYPTQRYEGTAELQREVDLTFEWGREPPTDSIPSDGWGAKYDTCLILDEPAEVTFMLVSDDGSRLFVNGRRVVDNWGDHAARARGGSIRLPAGSHHLHVDYYDIKYDAELELTASFEDKKAPTPLPASLLSFPGWDLPEDGSPCGE